jgi:hypothetical protein
MFRRAFDKRAERRMRRHKITPSQLSLFSLVSSFKKLKKKNSPLTTKISQTTFHNNDNFNFNNNNSRRVW